MEIRMRKVIAFTVDCFNRWTTTDSNFRDVYSTNCSFISAVEKINFNQYIKSNWLKSVKIHTFVHTYVEFIQSEMIRNIVVSQWCLNAIFIFYRHSYLMHDSKSDQRSTCDQSTHIYVWFVNILQLLASVIVWINPKYNKYVQFLRKSSCANRCDVSVSIQFRFI